MPPSVSQNASPTETLGEPIAAVPDGALGTVALDTAMPSPTAPSGASGAAVPGGASGAAVPSAASVAAVTEGSTVGVTVPGTVEPVRKSIRVRAGVERAFRVFTEEMDSWWPRTHHIGSSPMRRITIEGWAGGSVYTDQEDGTACPWGTVLAWEPPHRFVFAWQVSPTWQYEPDLARCSEVEVLFTPVDDGTTLVELEHRNLERHGGAFVQMRESVNSEGGWGSLVALFAEKANEPEPTSAQEVTA